MPETFLVTIPEDLSPVDRLALKDALGVAVCLSRDQRVDVAVDHLEMPMTDSSQLPDRTIGAWRQYDG